MTADRPLTFDAAAVFGLSPAQARAVQARGQDVFVTAGAGSGKTRTLIARYLSLLSEGQSPHQITAITFTEKAAREMRNRCREEIQRQIARSQPPEDGFWKSQQARLDAARIGTIHSLCAEILRTHPAEAGIDPQFSVLDEGAAAALRQSVVEQVLEQTISASDPDTVGTAGADLADLFRLFSVPALRRLLDFALQSRLDLAAWLLSDDPQDLLSRLVEELQAFLQGPAGELVSELRSIRQQGQLEELAGVNLALQLEDLLADWSQAEQALLSGQRLEGLALFCARRKANMALNTGKRTGRPKELLRELRQLYEAGPGRWLADDFDPAVELACQQALPRLRELFSRTLSAYQGALRRQGALDFDDLEALALVLLEGHAHVRRRWQGEIHSLLVDEFQDTNQRQRRLILALGGEQPGRLFFVGDDRQSIYRFRGADVTVLKSVLRQVQERQGEVLDLQTTYRANAPLLEAAGQLLEPNMQAPEPQPDYWVVFTPLMPNRDQPTLPGPVLEFVAAEERPAAAQALADHLLAMRAAGELQRWDQAALLFRASTHFSTYEDALEAAGIPFVTVAGRGFFDRPEIRDVLNLLRALANPWDDLAMAGLLRSPAFGLSDAALYLLRWPADPDPPRQPAPLYAALHTRRGLLPEPDRALAARAVQQLAELTPLADRLPVARLLERLVETTDLRAVYSQAGLRLVQNLDKLVEAAYASRIVSVRAFLEYVDTLRDVGARESEAPVEAAGAVQLMTIHKAKGLEFDVVILADAGYRANTRTSPAYLLAGIGFAAAPDRLEQSPLAHSYLAQLDRQQADAEEARLLYVALTRAREKLVISGHAGRSVKSTWLGRLSAAAGFGPDPLDPQAPERLDLPLGAVARLWTADRIAPSQPVAAPDASLQPDAHLPPGRSLAAPLPAESASAPPDRDPHPTAELRRRAGPSGAVVGTLVHLAIQHWPFSPGSASPPGGPMDLPADLERLLQVEARRLRLVDPDMRRQAIESAAGLIARLRRHPLWREIETASDRRHELAYTSSEAAAESGQIDLLYRAPDGWRMLEFKTDPLVDRSALNFALERYQPQVRRYQAALQALFAEPVQASLVFLDAAGEVLVEPVS